MMMTTIIKKLTAGGGAPGWFSWLRVSLWLRS